MIIFHIAREGDWKKALEIGAYRADSLAEQGFIHCCFAQQKEGVLSRFFADQKDLVIITLDTEKLSSMVKLENTEGGQELFPHVYGEINLEAVISCKKLNGEQSCNRTLIHPQDLVVRASKLWEENWLVLSAGHFATGEFNAMTVGWGSIGFLWNKPFVQIFVRPTRFTHSFVEKMEDFSLCAFSSVYQKSMSILGTNSGRNSSKLRDCGLISIPATHIDAPIFYEAELVIECKKMYRDILKPENFTCTSTGSFYPVKDYHHIYYGEILHIEGINKYY